jgi:hypothetical protein
MPWSWWKLSHYRNRTMNMTIGKRVIFGFTTLVILGIGIGVFTYNRLVKIRANAVSITTDALPGEGVSGDIQLDVAGGGGRISATTSLF